MATASTESGPASTSADAKNDKKQDARFAAELMELFVRKNKEEVSG